MTERQAQDLADLKQTREAERDGLRREQEAAILDHRNTLAATEAAARLTQQRLADEQAMELKQRAQGIDLEHQRNADKQRLKFLGGVGALKVDVTRYLVAQYQHPDRLIKIDGKTDTQFHLHELDR